MNIGVAPQRQENLVAALAIAVFISLACIACASFYLLARTGFTTAITMQDAFSIAGCALLIINGPVAVLRFSPSANHAFVQLVIIACIVLLGYTAFALAYGMAVLGGLSFIFTIASLLLLDIKWFVKSFSFGLLFSIILPLVAWSFSKHIAFFESLAFDASSYCCYFLDPLFQSSMTQMIKTYGVASTGLDGLPSMNYHVGSHWIFAQCASFFELHVIDWFHFGYPVIFLPLFFQALLVLAIDVRIAMADFRKINAAMLIITIVVVMGIIHTDIGNFGIENYVSGTLRRMPTYLTSESYLVSLTFMFLMGSLVMKLIMSRRWEAAISVPVMIALISVVKISTGYIVMVVVLYLFVRLKLFRSWIAWICTMSSVLIFLSVFSITVDDKVSEGAISYFHYYKVNEINLPLFLVGYFSPLLICLLYLVLWHNRGARFKDQILDGKLLIAEVLVIAAGASILPSFVMQFSSENALYFTDVVFWLTVISLLALTASLPSFKELMKRKAWLWLSVFVLLGGYFVHSYYNSWKRHANHAIYENNFFVRKELLGDTLSLTFKKELNLYFENKEDRDRIDSLLSPVVGQLAHKNKFYNLLWELKRLDTLSAEQKSQSVIYFDYMQMPQLHPFSCYQIPLLIPALTGMAMIDGAPPAGCIKEGYGFEYYVQRQQKDTPPALPDLIERVRASGFSYLIIYNIEQQGFSIVDCRGPS